VKIKSLNRNGLNKKEQRQSNPGKIFIKYYCCPTKFFHSFYKDSDKVNFQHPTDPNITTKPGSEEVPGKN
jgi:hypothetical protein